MVFVGVGDLYSDVLDGEFDANAQAIRQSLAI
jgi:hypothetical protein